MLPITILLFILISQSRWNNILFNFWNKSYFRLCVDDISDMLEMTIPAISQHLQKMKNQYLIQSDKKGQTINYSLTPDYKNFLSYLFETLTAVKLAPSYEIG